jgi:hypothetical protein
VRSARSTHAVLVVPAAVLAGHWIGYALAGDGHHGAGAVGHGYLPAAVAVALPALVAALVWVAVGSGGWARPRGSPPRVAPLVGAQWAVFVVQELTEHALAGDALGVVASPAVWLGLASQVAVAAATCLLLGASSRAGDRVVAVLGRTVRSVPPARGWWATPALVPAYRTPLRPVGSRGPPRPCR